MATGNIVAWFVQIMAYYDAYHDTIKRNPDTIQGNQTFGDQNIVI